MSEVLHDRATGLVDMPVRMERANLQHLPHYDLPPGYWLRTMLPEEAPTWTEVQRDAERVIEVSDGLFMDEFGSDLRAIEHRCFLLEAEGRRAVGTISAWYTADYNRTGANWGRLHWFAIRPSHQGRGLARPMISYVLERFAAWGHPAAWLATSTSRLPALKLYLDFGFAPDLEQPGAREVWARVRANLPHPALANL